jgi:hypothetical protein
MIGGLNKIKMNMKDLNVKPSGRADGKNISRILKTKL